jgi:vacuolar-type H+-ATPase subunit F/Vma7
VGHAAVIGPEHRVAGWSLAGVLVRPAATPAEAVAAWAVLPDDVVLVLLTPQAAAAVEAADTPRTTPRLRAVLP